MKYLAWFSGALVTLVVALYVVAFTPFGNGLIKPIVEKKIQNQTKLNSRFDIFIISMSDIYLDLRLDKSNSVVIKGSYSPFSQDVGIVYNLNFENLNTLESLMGRELSGVLHVDGNAKGNISSLVVKGKSDLAFSDTKFDISIEDFSIKSVKAQVDNLKLDKLFHTLGEPHYGDGVFSMYVDISDASVGSLKGQVITNVKNALFDSDYFTKLYKYNSTIPLTEFNSRTTTILNGNILNTKVDFNSSIATLEIEKASFNVKENSLKSDYVASILELDKLFFITGQHMRGRVTLSGDISKAKDLDITMHSEVAGGSIDAKVHNSDLDVDIKSVQTIDLLHMFKYPKIFSSSLNAKVDYSIKDSNGIFDGHVLDGHFVKNQTFDLIKKYTKIDMYRESFNGDVRAKIKKENILASIDLRSKASSIKTEDAKLNTKNRLIDSNITFQAKENIIVANLKGDVDSPVVTINLEELMKSEVGKKIEEGLNRLFQKLF